MTLLTTLEPADEPLPFWPAAGLYLGLSVSLVAAVALLAVFGA